MSDTGSENRERSPGGISVAVATPRATNMGTSGSSAASVEMQGSVLGLKRPKPHKIWETKHIKLLVVGDSGLGKTTLIRSLVSTPGERLKVHDGSNTPVQQFVKDPESLCSTISWRDEEDRVIWVYKMQDTPGYRDSMDLDGSIRVVLDYIEEQNVQWLRMEQSHSRQDLREVEDPRIDLCLFCIGPHRVCPSDLKFMYEVGLRVPVVPIVTKADTMTIREAGIYRSEVANKIANPMIQSIRGKINVFQFERDSLNRAGVKDSGTATPPFLVIASNDINEELNSGDPPIYWPERRYQWGTAEAFNKEHSDLLSLRSLLLKEALEDITRLKRQRYEVWRRRYLGGLRIGRRLRNLILFTLVPAVLCLQVGQGGLRIGDMGRMFGKVAGKIRPRRHRKSKPVVEPPPSPPPLPIEAPQKKGWFGI